MRTMKSGRTVQVTVKHAQIVLLKHEPADN
jgi:hypothetical protein